MTASLDRIFKSASGFFGHHHTEVDKHVQLELYGLFKQATQGDHPQNYLKSLFNFDPKARAWNKNKGKTMEEAKMRYIEEIEALNIGWSYDNHAEHGNIDGGMGISPSTLRGELHEPTTSFEIFYDAVRRGDIKKVCSVCEEDPYVAGTRDSTNGTAMHWAADANQYELLEYLPTYGFRVFDVDDEGQTPLHIAAICEYPRTILTLLDLGADPYAKDKENVTVMELMNSNNNLVNLPRIAGLY